MSFRESILTALFFFKAIQIVSGQNQICELFGHISVDDGLSQSTVNTIFQDSLGYMWFGTQEGLNRFDGGEFTLLKNNPADQNSLSHSWIWDITEDHQGNLWIATWNGLNKYNRITEEFTKYFPIPGDSTSISSTRPDCLLLDKSGNLWVATWGGGINLYRPQTDDFRRYLPRKNDPGAISHVLVRKVYQDIDGTIWIGTWGGGLNKYNPEHDNFTIYTTKDGGDDHITGDFITSISDGPGRTLWIGTYENGISIFDKKTRRFTNIRHPTFEFLSDKSITYLMMDRDSMVWIGTQNHGLFVYKYWKGDFLQFTQDMPEGSGIKGNYVYSIFQDNAGMVYVGNTGINTFHGSSKKFLHYKKAVGDLPGLHDANVWAFAQEKEGELWIGTESGGIYFMDLAGGTIKNFTDDKNGTSISNQYVKALATDQKGNLWIGSIGGGLERYDLKEKQFENINRKFPGTTFYDELRITSLASDTDNLWVGSKENGVFRYDFSSDTIVHPPREYNDTILISSRYVNALLLDRTGNLWIGGWGGGVSFLRKDSVKWIRYLHDKNNPKSLSNNIIHTLFQDEFGTIWVGTNQGLNKLIKAKSDDFNSFDEEFVQYFRKDGLPNDVIYAIEEDLDGNLWISTNHGLSKFDIETEQFTNFHVRDGLQSNQFNANSSLRLHDGAMIFGGINGFNLFYPSEIQIDLYQPPVLITKLETHGKNLNVDSVRALGNRLVLPYNRNFLSIEFAALEFIAPQKIRYSYILEGVDQRFIDSEGRRFANYTNLDPGSYIFRLRNTNRDGIWNDRETLLSVTILPPLWMRWWFILMAVSLITGLIYLFYRFRINRLLEIERLRYRIASDLHDDIGSSLTKISLYSELIKTERDSKVKSFYLGDINLLSKEVVISMGDIVWSIDARHDKMEDLLDRVKEFAVSVCEPANISIHFNINVPQTNKYLKPLYRQNIYLIFKEAINNIIKHSGADKVVVKINQTGNAFYMEIKDNGQGLNTDNGSKGHGLTNMQARAAQIGGKLTFLNDNGFIVSLQCSHLS